MLCAFVAAGTAAAAPRASHDDAPCWKILSNDAFDGKVDGIYPLPVYGEAITHLPTDVQSYSTIADVINRARQDALQKQGEGVKADPSRCGFALGSKGGGSGTGTTGGDGKGPIPGVIDKVGPDSADSFPVVLIVIIAVAAVLVLGGAAGFLLRRRQQAGGLGEIDGAQGTGPRELNR